jgi:S1-C subfamily serine protease
MKPRSTQVILLTGLTAGTLLGATFAFWAGEARDWLPSATAQPSVRDVSASASASEREEVEVPATPMTPEELANIRVYKLANPSVVNIDTSIVQYDRFFMSPIPGQGSGSGSIIDDQGHILTNFHVVEGARKIEVTFASNNTYSATLIGQDAEQDIAILKVDAPAEELKPITLGRSDYLRVGQRAYVLGNPFGLDGTLTTGIISSLNRTLGSRVEGRSMESIIQTDAAMNPGNSGGPLLDSAGRMIGMNVAIASKSGQSAGIGFAIPVNRIRQMIAELIEHGRIERPDHGIVAVVETEQGLKVVKVAPGGPADTAGLRGYRVVRERRRQGNMVYETNRMDRNHADYILAVDGEPVSGASDLLDLIAAHEPGDEVVLTVLREGERLRVPLTLGST